MATISGGLGVYRESWSGVSGNQSIGLTFGSGGGSYSGGGGSAAQQAFPTSAYGQTIPVIWGKARVPGAYIWAPDIIVKVTTTGAVLQTTTVTVNLSARIRFARPLEADSRWKLRRLWADGSLILDKSTGYRKSGLNIREYDGYSTQGRDPTMTSAEGTNNVSAHRGYLDIVITNYNLGTAGVPPPAFEAEWVQDATSSVDVDATTGFFSADINTYAAADWDGGNWYGVSVTENYLRRFDINTNAESFAVPITGHLVGVGGAVGSIEQNSLRYLPQMETLIAVDFVAGAGNGSYPCIIDRETGAILGHGEAMGPAGDSVNTMVAITFGPDVGALVTSSFSLGYLGTYKFTRDSIDRQHLSTTAWAGRGDVQCMAVGEERTGEADLYLVAGSELYRGTLNSNGALLNIEEIYSDADALIYCVYHEGSVLVWNDNQEIVSVDSETGAVNWTEAAPYQILSDGHDRSLASPDMHRLNGDIMVETSTAYWFTDLETGETTTVSKSSTSVGRQVYDGFGQLGINTDRTTEIARIQSFAPVSAGELRPLEDFLTDLMVSGGFDGSEIVCEGFSDEEIHGAVIDFTGGVRDIARSVCDPYSIAFFERAGTIVFKRSDTDGAFVVDVTIGSSDVLDRGGQAITATKMNPQEKPAKYGLNYRDVDEIYQARPQWGEIPSLPLPVAVTDIGIKADIPLIMEADTAKVIATKRIWRDAAQQHEFAKTLKAEHLRIEPETVAQFTYAGRLVTARVLENTIHPNFTNSIVSTEFLSSTAVTIAGATGRPVEPDPTGSTSSRYVHLDIPLRSDVDDLNGDGFRQYHRLASGGQPFWAGAQLLRKEGDSFIAQATEITDALIGIALEVLPDVDIAYATEFDRTLSVAFPTNIDLPTSLTYEEMLSGTENYFAIGQPGRWEIVQVQTITNNGNGTTTLETFRRCLDQSEEYTGDHLLGDMVVYLSDGEVQGLEYSIAALDDAYDYKAVGIGASALNTPTVSRTVTGEAEKIPKPGNLKAAIDGADIDLSWTRRSRIGGGVWMDDGEDEYTTPLGETLEQYVIRIKDGPGGTVLRTVTVDDATDYTYSAANITTDFGSMPDELTYDIRQVSGTGVVCPTREATITL